MVDGHLRDVVEFVLSGIDRLPNPPREPIKREFMKLEEMLLENRAPRILVVGRRGAGKSSLINAIFGERVAAVGAVLSKTGKPVWHTFETPKGGLRILDTRGIGDRTRPESSTLARALRRRLRGRRLGARARRAGAGRSLSSCRRRLHRPSG